VNLDAAVAPLGSLTIPLSDSPTGQTATLAGTVLSLGPAFGDALNGSPLLGEAFALDDFDRNYVAGLDSHVFRAKRGFGLQALMASGGIEAIETELANGANLSMGVVENTRAESAAYWAGMAADAAPERRVHGLSLAMTAGDGTTWRFGYDLAPGQLISDAAATSATLFWMAGDLMNPHHALVGAGTAIAASRSLGAGNTISLDMVDEADGDDAIAGDARMGEIVLARTIGDGAVVTARISNLDETEGFLGAGAAGGFAVGGANSWFYQLGGRLPLGAGVELLGSYTLARTDMVDSGASVLGDWSGTQADAFGFGIVKSNVLGAGGRIGVLAGQPLRVSSASASLTVPVGYELDKTVVQASERVSLVPSGREIDVQLAYDTPVGAQGSFAGWLMMQLEPGHDADAATAYAVGLRFGMSF